MNEPEPDNEYEDVDFDDLLEDDDSAESDLTGDETDFADADDATEAREYSQEKARATKRKIAAPDETERLQKLIARTGVASRRAAEEMIFAGRVTVNDEVVREAGFKASRRDRIAVDGRVLRFPTGASTVVLLHKPVHVVTTKSDPQGRTTVTDFLPSKLSHLHPIGRLDFDTTGLLLLTDDGELTQLLTHPSHGIEKVYLARVRGTVALSTVKNLEAGVFLDDGKTAPCRVRVRAQTEKNALLQITLREGKNRQVRRMLEHVGHPASALRRVRVGNIEIEDIPAGAYRILLNAEVHELKKLATRGPKKTPQRKTASRAKTAEPPKTPRASTRDSDNAPRTANTKPSRATAPKTAASRNEKSTPAAAPRELKPNRNAESRAPKSPRETSSPRETPRSGPARATATRPATGRATETRFSNSSRDTEQRGVAGRGEETRAGQFSRGDASRETAPSRNATPRRVTPSSRTRNEMQDDKAREYSPRGADARRDVAREEENRPHPLANRIERSFERGARDTAAKQRREFAQQNAAPKTGVAAKTGAAARDGAALRPPKPRGSGALHDSKQPRTNKKPRGGGKNSRKKPAP